MTVPEWKAALLTLSDGPFFDLMRSYLGDIRTPFNKQRLIDELEGFLGRREIQETVAAYLDDTDKVFIAAVGALGDPLPAELAHFFEGEFSFAELHAVLLNLEERLILFRVDDSAGRRLALNPALGALLAPLAADAERLFPSLPLDEADAAAPAQPLDDLFLASVVCHLRRLPALFRSDGEFRKKASDEAAAIFPFERFAQAVEALQALGAVSGHDEGVRVDDARLSALAALETRTRALYVAAALCGGASEASPSGSPGHRGRVRVSRERLSGLARFLRAFLERLDPARRYPRPTLNRLLDAALREGAPARKRRWDLRSADPGADLRGSDDHGAFRAAALRALEAAGFLAPAADECLRLLPAAAEAWSGPAPSGRAPVGVDAAFSVLLHPELPFADALRLGRFLDAGEAGVVARFELTRQSAVRGFDGGLSPQDLCSALEDLSGRPLPQNVRWSVKEWHERYSAVAVHRGVVLTLSEERRYLLEAEGVASLVSRVLAPGVYLLKVDEASAAVAALEKAGCDIVALPAAPAPAGEGAGTDESAPHFSYYAPLDRPFSKSPRFAEKEKPASAGIPSAPLSGADADERRAALHAALDAKSLPKDQKDELAARVDRRVVLAESQLVGAAVRYEKLEAKGLDYVGKVRVAEQALSSQSLVEIFWRGPKGEPNRALGTPVSLDKSGGEVDLSVDPAPRGERIKVSVGKISLIRRIRRSIFGE